MKQIECSKNTMKRVTWTDEDAKIKPGNLIRFKDEKDFWIIEKVHNPSIQKNEINRTWHVGGL